MNLKDSGLSEISQAQKMVTYFLNVKSLKSYMYVCGGGRQIYQRKRIKQWLPSAGSGTEKKKMEVRDCDGTDRWTNKARGLTHNVRISISKTTAERVGFGCPCHERRGNSEMTAGSVLPQ